MLRLRLRAKCASSSATRAGWPSWVRVPRQHLEAGARYQIRRGCCVSHRYDRVTVTPDHECADRHPAKVVRQDPDRCPRAERRQECLELGHVGRYRYWVMCGVHEGVEELGYSRMVSASPIDGHQVHQHPPSRFHGAAEATCPNSGVPMSRIPMGIGLREAAGWTPAGRARLLARGGPRRTTIPRAPPPEAPARTAARGATGRGHRRRIEPRTAESCCRGKLAGSLSPEPGRSTR